MPVFGPDAVNRRLTFAESRFKGLGALEKKCNGHLGYAKREDTEQLVQEFFFHLVGAREFLLQVVNESRNLGIDPEDVSGKRVLDELTRRGNFRFAVSFPAPKRCALRTLRKLDEMVML